jgi:hypothetical protein
MSLKGIADVNTIMYGNKYAKIENFEKDLTK